MHVRTSIVLDRPVDAVWPLLYHSRLGITPRCPVFYLGVPRPVECRLPDGEGGVGGARECVSEQGVVAQRITEWAPGQRLAFHMEATELAFADWLTSLRDEFDLVPMGDGATLLTRTTRVELRGRLRWAKLVAVFVGLKAVHRFVFRAWSR